MTNRLAIEWLEDESNWIPTHTKGPMFSIRSGKCGCDECGHWETDVSARWPEPHPWDHANLEAE